MFYGTQNYEIVRLEVHTLCNFFLLLRSNHNYETLTFLHSTVIGHGPSSLPEGQKHTYKTQRQLHYIKTKHIPYTTQIIKVANNKQGYKQHNSLVTIVHKAIVLASQMVDFVVYNTAKTFASADKYWPIYVIMTIRLHCKEMFTVCTCVVLGR